MTTTCSTTRDCRVCTEFTDNHGDCPGFLCDGGACGAFVRIPPAAGAFDPETGDLIRDREERERIRRGYSPAERVLARSVRFGTCNAHD